MLTWKLSYLIMENNVKYNCLIVDDEPPAREVLKRYIAQLPMLHLAGECSNALQAAAMLKSEHIDILFLDIQMPQLSGLDLIGAIINPPKIILTTAFGQYAVKAFELEVTDYLLKPVSFERFLKAVMKALPDQNSALQAPVKTGTVDFSSPTFLYFRADRKMIKVQLDDIQYVESLKDYVKIHTTRGTVITKFTMASIEAMLPVAAFLRVHRSYLVASDKIDSYTPDEVYISAREIPIGAKYQMQVLAALKGVNR